MTPFTEIKTGFVYTHLNTAYTPNEELVIVGYDNGDIKYFPYTEIKINGYV